LSKPYEVKLKFNGSKLSNEIKIFIPSNVANEYTLSEMRKINTG